MSEISYECILVVHSNYSEPVRMAVSVHAKLGQGWWSARELAHGCAIERLREQK